MKNYCNLLKVYYGFAILCLILGTVLLKKNNDKFIDCCCEMKES